MTGSRIENIAALGVRSFAQFAFPASSDLKLPTGEIAAIVLVEKKLMVQGVSAHGTSFRIAFFDGSEAPCRFEISAAIFNDGRLAYSQWFIERRDGGPGVKVDIYHVGDSLGGQSPADHDGVIDRLLEAAAIALSNRTTRALSRTEREYFWSSLAVGPFDGPGNGSR